MKLTNFRTNASLNLSGGYKTSTVLLLPTINTSRTRSCINIMVNYANALRIHIITYYVKQPLPKTQLQRSRKLSLSPSAHVLVFNAHRSLSHLMVLSHLKIRLACRKIENIHLIFTSAPVFNLNLLG